MKRLIGLVLACALTAGVAVADTHTWVGGSHTGGGWNTASNWQNESGAAECPEAGDTAVFNKYDETVVANDDDAELACSLECIKLTSWSYALNKGQTLVFDFSEDYTAKCAICGNGGRFFKKGKGTLRLDNGSTAYSGGAYSTYTTYDITPGGIVAAEGTLWFPQKKNLLYGLTSGGLCVSNNATVYLPNDKDFYVATLSGEGTVTVANADKAHVLQIGMASDDAGTCTFGGKLTGTFSVNSYAGLTLTGVESDVTVQILRAKPRDGMKNGYVAVAKLGNSGEASSVGMSASINLLYSACFRYIGSGEISTKNLYYDWRGLGGNSGTPGPVIFDGGDNGGLVLNGSLSYYSSTAKMGSVIFCGSNSTPCVVGGAFSACFDNDGDKHYTPYIIKRGPGVWRFADHATRTHRGVYEVQEGTLQFDSIAEAGTVCALGYATSLQSLYTGDYDAGKDVPYAYLLGREGAQTNAVFEFTGARTGSCSTRPIALAGDAHLRANGAAGAALKFSGLSPLSAGAEEKTLTLDGTNTDANVLADVTDVGSAKLSVTKSGPGTWNLEGQQSFRGDLAVKEGVLKVRQNLPYDWFRFTCRIKKSTSGVTLWMGKLALYDAEGNRLATDMVFDQGETQDGNYHFVVDRHALQPGHCCWEAFSTTPATDNVISQASENPALGFRDNTSTMGRVIYRRGTSFQYFSTDFAGAPLVFRLPEGSAKPVRYDVSSYGSEKFDDWLVGWSIEGSVDGDTWVTLDERKIENVTTDLASAWYSNGDKVSERPSKCPDTGFVLDYPEADSFGKVASLSVDSGAAFAVEGETEVAVDRIVVDVAKGIGSWSGLSFAADMTVEVENVPKGKALHIPADFTGVVNFDDVASWTFLVDGEAPKKCSFKISKTGLDIIPNGLILLLR